MPDLSFIRSQFPSLNGEWVFLDNAGGTQTARQVGDRLMEYLYTSNVQHGASYDVSRIAGERVTGARNIMAEFINASSPAEIILGSSTTQLLQNLAKSLVQTFKPGDEVIVTNCDHEANIGPWISMEREGIRIKFWNINPESFELSLEDLDGLITDKTRLVAFTHVSNILGTINPVKEYASFIHDRGALVCVDGVAYAPHRLIDVKDLDVDFYAFSLYKVYGPHYSLLFGKRELLEKLPGINHYFIGDDEIPYKFQPGNVNYELAYSLLGVADYFNTLADHSGHGGKELFRSRISLVFDEFARHEEDLAKQFLSYLGEKRKAKIIGLRSAEKEIRVPTISFTVDGMKSSKVPLETDRHKIAIRYGDFYARRLIDELGLSSHDGVVRVSMVHYNTIQEVERLIYVLDHLL